MTHKQIIRLTESDLHNVIKKAVKEVIHEHRKLRSDEKATVQYDLFDPAHDEVTITRPKRVSGQEKDRRKAIKKAEKEEARQKAKRDKEKEIEKRWNARGIFQTELFSGLDTPSGEIKD